MIIAYLKFMMLCTNWMQKDSKHMAVLELRKNEGKETLRLGAALRLGLIAVREHGGRVRKFCLIFR